MIAAARALLALARPRLAPFVLMLPLVGFGWAHWDGALSLRGADALAWVLAAWAALHAGTLWLNAHLDRDTGEVLLGEAVAPPDCAPLAGYAALGLSVGMASQAGGVTSACAAACAGLAVAYSHPRLAWKGHAAAGPLVNLVGYGLLSPIAGWSCAGVAPTARSVVMVVVAGLGVLGAYFVAQAFQGDEDRARGYRTLVARGGPVAAIDAARLCFGAGYLVCGLLAAVGWLPRAALAGIVTWWAVDAALRRWRARPDGGTAADASAVALRLAASGLVVLALVFGEYARQSFAGEPVAGLGTVSGHPPAAGRR